MSEHKTETLQCYTIQSTLVNRLIGTIIASILAIGGYMIVWALNDAQFKAEVRSSLIEIRRNADNFEKHMERPCHDVACERLRQIERHPHHQKLIGPIP